jgi:hypothetical protein
MLNALRDTDGRRTPHWDFAGTERIIARIFGVSPELISFRLSDLGVYSS